MHNYCTSISGSPRPESAKYLRFHQVWWRQFPLPAQRQDIYPPATARNSYFFVHEAIRRKVPVGSSEGHLGPAGSSGGCIAKLNSDTASSALSEFWLLMSNRPTQIIKQQKKKRAKGRVHLSWTRLVQNATGPNHAVYQAGPSSKFSEQQAKWFRTCLV
jgi:hypothetical protein